MNEALVKTSAYIHSSEGRTLKWLILVGLLWAQFAYAEHQVAHDADSVGEICPVCVSCEQLDNALSDTMCVCALPSAVSSPTILFEGHDGATHPGIYRARASP